MKMHFALAVVSMLVLGCATPSHRVIATRPLEPFELEMKQAAGESRIGDQADPGYAAIPATSFQPQARSSQTFPSRSYGYTGGATTTRKIGDSYFSSDGSSSRRIGDSWFNSDGGSTRKIGDSYFHSDGTSTRRVGDTWFNSDGGSTRKIGDSYFHSDGSVTRRIGDSFFTN